MQSGTNGQIPTVKITWEQFQEWQRWDEYPERKYDPPLIVDMIFCYKGKTYYLDIENYKYGIFNDKGDAIATDTNFRNLLTKPIKEWNGNSFRQLIEKMTFQN